MDSKTKNIESETKNMPNIYDIKWQRSGYDDTITISRSYFEHLLNCLANQKFIGEPPPNADALTLGKSEYNNIQIKNQKVIDSAWRSGMFILSLNHIIEENHDKMNEKYFEMWNNNVDFINHSIHDDIKDYPNDKNIDLKWLQLVPQEISMWIHLCCFSDIIIDCENEKYTHGVVTIGDFDAIVFRRGFTPTMRNFLIDVLKHVGIGEQLYRVP